MAPRPLETAPKPKATEQAQVNKGLAPKTSGATAPRAPRYPEVASDAKGFVDAYQKAGKAMNQMAMVEGSVDINNAADKLLAKTMNELASQLADRGQDAKQLGQVNKEPAGEYQQAYNRQAGGDAVMQEARFAIAFKKAYDKDEKVGAQVETFFKGLPKKIDSQIESRGGSMEPLERAGGTATALAEMTKKLGGE